MRGLTCRSSTWLGNRPARLAHRGGHSDVPPFRHVYWLNLLARSASAAWEQNKNTSTSSCLGTPATPCRCRATYRGPHGPEQNSNSDRWFFNGQGVLGRLERLCLQEKPQVVIIIIRAL